MNRNYKPHVALVALLVLALIVSFVCNGCAVEVDAAVKKTNERFSVEYAGNGCSIITDNETGVQYLLYTIETHRGKGVGLTRLEEE